MCVRVREKAVTGSVLKKKKKKEKTFKQTDVPNRGKSNFLRFLNRLRFLHGSHLLIFAPTS